MFEKEGSLAFILSEEPLQLCWGADGKPSFEAVLEGEELRVSAWYTAREEPLTLRAAAKPGDKAVFVYYPWRIELYVNGELKDEEWPFGDPLYPEGIRIGGSVWPIFGPVPETQKQPAVIGTFTGAEGWYPGNGVFVGDCMPYACGDRYHVLYLKDRHHHGSKWGKGAHQWEHLSTADLIHWDCHPMAVAIDDPAEGSICTGSWILVNGVHQLYYTVRSCDGSPAPVCRSVSEDGFHFHKDKGFRFTLSERYTGNTARDPKVVHGEDGLYHMFVTTTQISSGRGCLVHLTSADGESWTENDPIYLAPKDMWEPECPDYFTFGGKYYLIFSLCGRAHYLYSDEPFTGWQEPKDPIIPCSSVPKAAVWHDRIVFTGFRGIDGYAGSLTFMEAFAGENGELTFAPVKETEEAK